MINKYNIKDSQREIVKLIIKEPGLSRVEISKKTNLNKSTLSYITKDLEKNNLIKFKKEKNSKGRLGSYIYFNYSYEKVLFIEYGKRKIKSFICFLDGKILKEYIIKLEDNANREQVLHDHLMYLKKEYPLINNCVFALHGTVNIISNELKSPFYPIDYNEINSIFKEFNINVIIENEANIYSLGLLNKNFDDIIINIQIKDGIGGSVILNGELFKGKDGLAGEIGHTIAKKDGKLCNCGNKGCLEVYASDENTIIECRQKTLQSITKSTFLEHYHSSHFVKEIIDRNISMIGKALNDICTTFNPSVVHISSEVYYNIPNIEQRLSSELISTALNKPTIVVENYDISIFIKGFANLYMIQVI